MTVIAKYAPHFTGKTNRAWKDLDLLLEGVLVQIGGVPINVIDSPASNVKPVAVPPLATANVVGLDGKFMTFITNPQSFVPQSVAVARNQWENGINVGNATIIHHLESATSLNFDAASNLKDYGTGPQLLWTDQDPNVTRFFRWQSSYDGKNWNEWQVYSSPLTCGPVGVQSGLLRTAALTQVNAAYTPTTQPLTAATGVAVNNASIGVAAFQVKYPSSISPASGNLVSYNSGTISGLLDATLYYVYCLDTTYAGGAQTYFATTDNPTVTGNEATVYLGTVTTPVHGGGGTGGGGGGSGPCFTGNTLILVERSGVVRAAPIAHLKAGDQVLTLTGWRRVRRILEHPAYTGLMYRMPDRNVTKNISTRHEFVTPAHRIFCGLKWVRADEVFSSCEKEIVESKTVFNLEVDGDGSDETQCYTLANGWVAHNQIKR